MKRLFTVKAPAIVTAIVLGFSLCAGGCSRQAVVDEMGNSNPISIDPAPVTEYVDDAGNPVLPEWQGGTGISEAELERYGAEYAQKVIDNAQPSDQNKSTPQIPDIIPKDPVIDSPASPSDSGSPKTAPVDSGESTSPEESLPHNQDENLPVTTNEYYSLPVMSIDTGGTAIVSKSEYINAKVTITNTDANNCITEVTAGIRGRGNSTWALFDKKPYRIRFDSNIDLFGMGKARSYVLLSNNMDMTLMRNYLAFKLSDIMEIEYNSGYQSMGSSTHGGTGYTGWFCGTVFPWGDALLQIPEFMSLVKERYNQKLPQIKELVSVIDQCVNDYSFDIAMNNLRWPIMGTDYWRCPPEFLNKTDYQWHTDFLKNWLTNRLEHYTSLVNQL